MTSPDIILIDDSPIVRWDWEQSLRRGSRRILTFPSERQFRLSMAEINPKATIFVDQELETDRLGEVVTKDLYQQGFENLYICTSHMPEDFAHVTWVKGIVDKTPPMWLAADTASAPLTAVEKKALLGAMTPAQLADFQSRMAEFVAVVHGTADSGLPGLTFDGFTTPDIVLKTWKRGIYESLDAIALKERVDHAWRLAVS